MYSLLEDAFEFCLSSFVDEHNNFNKINQEKHTIEQIILHLEPHVFLPDLLCKRWLTAVHQDGISVIRMEFLSPSRRCSSSQNVPSGECDNVAVFSLLLFHFRSTCAYVIVLPWQRIFKGHAFWVLSFAACKLFWLNKFSSSSSSVPLTNNFTERSEENNCFCRLCSVENDFDILSISETWFNSYVVQDL